MEDRLRVEDMVYFRVVADAEVAKEEAAALATLRSVSAYVEKVCDQTF